MARWRRRFSATGVAVREVLAEPPLRRAETAYLLAVTGDVAFTVTLGVVAFRDGGAGAVGLVALLRMVPSAVGSTVLTAFADRVRREQVLMVASIVRAGAMAGSATLLAADASAVGVYALAIVATAAMTIFRPVHSALMPMLCSDTAELTSANVVRGILEAAATLAGPLVAGILLAVASPSAVFAAIAVLAALVVVPLLGIRTPPPAATPSAGARAVVAEVADGLRTVAHHRDLRLIFGLGFSQTVVRGALNVFVVVVGLELLETNDSGVAVLVGALGVGGLIGSFGASLLVGSRRLGLWLSLALALWGAPIAVMGVAPETVVVGLMLAVVGLANTLIDVPLFTLPVRLVDDAVLARAFGVFEALVAVGVGLGSVVSPVLIDLIGVRPALAVTGLSLPVIAVLALRRLRMMDARLGVRDEEISVLRRAELLSLLPVPIIEHLASRVQRGTVPAGSAVVEQGDSGSSVYVVVDGRADVVGDGTVIARLGPGDAFGEIAVLQDVPRTASVVAATDLQLFELRRDDFLAALGRHQASSDAAYAVVAEHLANFRPVSFGP